MEVGKYASAHSINHALAKFSKQYPKCTFRRTSINSWKASFKNNGNSQNLKKIGRPNLVSRTAEKNKGRYYWFMSCRHCHFKKDGNRHGTGVVKAND